jgi:hypothetical protein
VAELVAFTTHPLGQAVHDVGIVSSVPAFFAVGFLYNIDDPFAQETHSSAAVSPTAESISDETIGVVPTNKLASALKRAPLIGENTMDVVLPLSAVSNVPVTVTASMTCVTATPASSSTACSVIVIVQRLYEAHLPGSHEEQTAAASADDLPTVQALHALMGGNVVSPSEFSTASCTNAKPAGHTLQNSCST